jgi:hypothetical protein
MGVYQLIMGLALSAEIALDLAAEVERFLQTRETNTKTKVRQ